MVRWEGYNFMGDTFEPASNVTPASLVKKWDKGETTSCDIRALHDSYDMSMSTVLTNYS